MAYTPGDPTDSSALNSAPVRNNLTALFEGDFEPLRVRAQTSPDMTLDVEDDNDRSYVLGNIPLDFAGGNSPTFTAPGGASEKRIDLLTLDSSGTLAITTGVATTGTPVAPAFPSDKIVLVEVFLRQGAISIKNLDDATNGYIFKTRTPLFNMGSALSDASPQDIGATAAGTNTSGSRDDHVHASPSVGIGRGDLKTSQGEVSTTSTLPFLSTLPGGEYGFYPQVKRGSSGSVTATLANGSTNTSFASRISIHRSSGNGTVRARQRYVTASGKEHWIFILFDKTKKEIVSMYEAPDHPCFGNGNDPDIVPHPFADYHDKPLPQNMDISLVDIGTTNMIKAKRTKTKRILDIIEEQYKPEITKTIPFVKRDMDGKRMLNKKHGSYKVRKLIPK